MRFQIPEYNERIIADTAQRPGIRIQEPEVLKDMSFARRIGKQITDTVATQKGIELEMKKERDAGIANEFMNQFSIAKAEKLNELKQKYKGANSQGIIDEYKRWQDEYYNSRIGFNPNNNDDTLYLENEEQMTDVRNQLTRSLASDINTLSTYVAGELEGYRKNQFESRIGFLTQNLTGERDVNNIVLGVDNIKDQINRFYAGESPEFLAYTAGKLTDNAFNVNITNAIASGATLEQLQIAEDMLNNENITGNMFPATVDMLKQKLLEKQLKLIGSTLGKASAKRGGGGSVSDNTIKKAGEGFAFVDDSAEIEEAVNAFNSVTEGMTQPEKSRAENIAREAFVKAETEGKSQIRETNKTLTDTIFANVYDMNVNPQDVDNLSAQLAAQYYMSPDDIKSVFDDVIAINSAEVKEPVKTAEKIEAELQLKNMALKESAKDIKEGIKDTSLGYDMIPFYEGVKQSVSDLVPDVIEDFSRKTGITTVLDKAGQVYAGLNQEVESAAEWTAGKILSAADTISGWFRDDTYNINTFGVDKAAQILAKIEDGDYPDPKVLMDEIKSIPNMSTQQQLVNSLLKKSAVDNFYAQNKPLSDSVDNWLSKNIQIGDKETSIYKKFKQRIGEVLRSKKITTGDVDATIQEAGIKVLRDMKNLTTADDKIMNLASQIEIYKGTSEYKDPVEDSGLYKTPIEKAKEKAIKLLDNDEFDVYNLSDKEKEQVSQYVIEGNLSKAALYLGGLRRAEQ